MIIHSGSSLYVTIYVKGIHNARRWRWEDDAVTNSQNFLELRFETEARNTCVTQDTLRKMQQSSDTNVLDLQITRQALEKFLPQPNEPIASFRDAYILHPSHCLLLILGLNSAVESGRWHWCRTRWPCCTLQTSVFTVTEMWLFLQSATLLSRWVPYFVLHIQDRQLFV